MLVGSGSVPEVWAGAGGLAGVEPVREYRACVNCLAPVVYIFGMWTHETSDGELHEFCELPSQSLWPELISADVEDGQVSI